jgi:molybdate transport system substrate-binding protein
LSGLKSIAAFLLLSLATCLHAQKLRIAAASDLGPAFKEVSAGFEKQTGARVELITGSSGNFFAQIQNGAPFDLFFSADREYARRLQDAGQADHLTEYAEGTVVLWVPNGSKLNLNRGMKVLLDPAVKKVAIANPAHAPYGRAAVSALEHFGLYEKVKDKLVFGENISQTTQFIQSGGAEIGITALSLALSPALKDEGRYVEIPHDAYVRMVQSAVVLKSSKEAALAEQFLEYLHSPEVASIMKRYGFPGPAAEKPEHP